MAQPSDWLGMAGDRLRSTLADFRNIWGHYWFYLFVLTISLGLAWSAHFNVEVFGHGATFFLCFLAMVFLQKMFDWGGEKLGAHIVQGGKSKSEQRKDLKDLLVITMSNAIEATLAIILLFKCQLRLLQSTIIGVLLLHMLLIPGTAFFYQGLHTYEQKLHPLHSSLNHSLLMIGVLAIAVPTAFFAALDRGTIVSGSNSESGLPGAFVPLVSDGVRRDILRMSRGISVVLLVIYIASRVWRHSGPLGDSADEESDDNSEFDSQLRCNCQCNRRNTAQENQQPNARNTATNEDGDLHHWSTYILTLVIAVGLMGATAEFLVSSTEAILTVTSIQTEWFGLILLPFVSFSADGVNVVVETSVAIFKYCWEPTEPNSTNNAQGTIGSENGISQRKKRKFSMWDNPLLTSEFAHGRPIDVSIQFTLCWTPLLVLFGWWFDKPMHLLFDYFEVGMLLGACLLVNYVTIDAKTNLSEGLTMISFYVMIATAAWWYPGQPQVADFLSCPSSVASAIANGVEGSGNNLARF
ncbi:transporter [Ganoderma sinense ZZ0214-1]|uniref:Transporter n=1 Tax=Ganoderma sinense ZZ0214-1 TaxID=1077348 RepID=A0A2G8SFQ6_9APHY|nr:transporter [Ganoderma sinense ZZ0214-1]